MVHLETLFSLQNAHFLYFKLIKNSLIYLLFLVLDVFPIYFPLCFVFRINVCLVGENYLLHFNIDFNMLNLEYERCHDCLSVIYMELCLQMPCASQNLPSIHKL